MARRLNEHTTIEIFPGDQSFQKKMASQSFQMTAGKIRDVVRNELLYPAKVSYVNARVRTVHEKPDVPKHLIVYLAHRHSFMATTARITIKNDYSVESVDHDYKETDQERQSFTGGPQNFTTIDPDVEMVFATPITYWPSCTQRVTDAYNAAITAGYKAVKLIGTDATVNNYKYCFTHNLKAFGSIGHGLAAINGGACYGLMLSDGNLYSYDQWFQNIGSSAFSPEVIYLNSCCGFLAPFGDVVKGAGPRTYISGNVDLQENDISERCFAGFWETVLPQNAEATMSQALNANEIRYGIHGENGIYGDEGVFKNW